MTTDNTKALQSFKDATQNSIDTLSPLRAMAMVDSLNAALKKSTLKGKDLEKAQLDINVFHDLIQLYYAVTATPGTNCVAYSTKYPMSDSNCYAGTIATYSDPTITAAKWPFPSNGRVHFNILSTGGLFSDAKAGLVNAIFTAENCTPIDHFLEPKPTLGFIDNIGTIYNAIMEEITTGPQINNGPAIQSFKDATTNSKYKLADAKVKVAALQTALTKAKPSGDTAIQLDIDILSDLVILYLDTKSSSPTYKTKYLKSASMSYTNTISAYEDNKNEFPVDVYKDKLTANGFFTDSSVNKVFTVCSVVTSCTTPNDCTPICKFPNTNSDNPTAKPTLAFMDNFDAIYKAINNEIAAGPAPTPLSWGPATWTTTNGLDYPNSPDGSDPTCGAGQLHPNVLKCDSTFQDQFNNKGIKPCCYVPGNACPSFPIGTYPSLIHGTYGIELCPNIGDQTYPCNGDKYYENHDTFTKRVDAWCAASKNAAKHSKYSSFPALKFNIPGQTEQIEAVMSHGHGLFCGKCGSTALTRYKLKSMSGNICSDTDEYIYFINFQIGMRTWSHEMSGYGAIPATPDPSRCCAAFDAIDLDDHWDDIVAPAFPT